ncbi:MAG: site-specific integrase [Puia sp.]
MAATVEVVYRKDKTNEKNEAPIYIRITKNRKVQYVATGHKINKKHWDERLRKVKSSYANSVRLNHYLNKLKVEYQDGVLQQETKNMTISAKTLKSAINGSISTDFFRVAEMLIQGYAADKKIRTCNKARSIIQKLGRFVKCGSLPFDEVTPMFLTKYEQHLKTDVKNRINTIDKDMRFIRRVFNEARRLEVITNMRSPFESYKSKKERTQRIYLSEDELNKIESVTLPKDSQLSLYRDMFVFSCYAGGLRISDLLLLQVGYYDGTHINFTIKKTGSQLSIKLPEKAKAILEKYYNDKSRNKEFIFPVLKKGVSSDPEKLNQAISSATAYINKMLKKVALLAEVDKSISTHIARHTWATRALRFGISIDKVSKLMGHADIKETQLYAKIVNKELDKAMDQFNS